MEWIGRGNLLLFIPLIFDGTFTTECALSGEGGAGRGTIILVRVPS